MRGVTTRTKYPYECISSETVNIPCFRKCFATGQSTERAAMRGGWDIESQRPRSMFKHCRYVCTGRYLGIKQDTDYPHGILRRHDFTEMSFDRPRKFCWTTNMWLAAMTYYNSSHKLQGYHRYIDYICLCDWVTFSWCGVLVEPDIRAHPWLLA